MNKLGATAPLAKAKHHRTATGRQQRARTEAKIIAVAIKVFARKGPFTPVIDDFVKAAGISRGTFYNYFSTTEELFEAAIDAVSNEFIDSILPITREIKNPVVRFACAARLYCQKAEADPVFASFVSALSHVGSLAGQHAREDLQEAVAMGLVEVKSIEAALLAAVGAIEFAVRDITKKTVTRRVSGTEVVRLVLHAWRVKPELIAQALAVKLPKVVGLQSLKAASAAG